MSIICTIKLVAVLIILFVISGAIFFMSTNDLVSTFLSIELQSYGCAPNEAFVIEASSVLIHYTLSDILGTNIIVYLSRIPAVCNANNLQTGIAGYENRGTNTLQCLDTPISECDHGQANELDTYREAPLGQKAQCSYSRLSQGNFKVSTGRPYSTDSQEPKTHCNTADRHTQGPKITTNVNKPQLRDLTAYEVNRYLTRGRSFHSSIINTKGSSRNALTLQTQISNLKDFDKPNLETGGKSNKSISIWLHAELDKYLKGDGKYNGLINIISDVDYLKYCYTLIKSIPGNMSEGSGRTTSDSISNKWFEKTSQYIKSGKFSFSPRVMIPKLGKTETRALSVGNPRRKIIQKAIFLILELIWEPTFSKDSYGFRTNRTLHQALHHLYYNGSPYQWVIQGDISKCFDRIPHQKILDAIEKKVKCAKTISLIKKLITAGHIDPESGDFIKKRIGTSQGNILTPILANIVLDNFDKYIDESKLGFEKGKKRARNKQYDALTSKIAWIRKSKPGSPLIKELDVQRRELTSLDMFDPNFKRLMYLRYANDFIVLIIGSVDEAKMIRLRIADFLFKKCGLELNKEKTTISATKNGFTFLGAHCIKPNVIKAGLFTNKNPAKIRMRIEAPIEKLLNKLVINKFAYRDENGRFHATARRDLVNSSHWETLSFYNSRILGLLNFYSFAVNYNGLRNVVLILWFSCALTLALKYKLRTKRQIFKKFGRYLNDPESDIKLYVPKDYKVKHKYSRVNKPSPDSKQIMIP